MSFLSGVVSALPLHWWIVLIASSLGITAVCFRLFESEQTRAKRAEHRKQRELKALIEKISAYAREVHERYPTGDMVVSERDLAEQLRKRTDVVVTALNLLLNEQKVQRAPLSGYWRLNI